MRLTVTPTSPRQPAARGAALATLTNTVGWFTIVVAGWAGLSGAVPLWAGALLSLAGAPAAAWSGTPDA